MKTTVRSERRGRSGARGFTLIELLVAIAIMAVIAVLSWRGLDQIIRGRETITNAMEDERVFAQLFDQMRIDVRQAASDDESGQAAVSVSGSVLQIVREMVLPGTAPRLQVVRYRVSEGRVVRYASPPLGNVGELRGALRGGEGNGWTAVPLMGGVGAISARLYVPKVGWTTQMKDVQSAITENDNNLKVPQLGNAPLPRSVTGLEVSVGGKSLARPVTRVFLVGE
ncbi:MULTISPECIES: PulJ/GspJ family protein [Paraburkholderia]|jgi:general secretion pathway protein J|uniref:Prepilin-type N-terminal cleavage/methylation domain-containing protein n=1 Tax=Paraburkholderia madseniana TaxID=2599607 RepID=A0AAP5BM37_9BURK|nr:MULTISPECIES: prepilin-type N-terminal cleavage/methylation domain-containing protein [Paraburkholderia]MCX4150672.1 prepilin-type N-terminal cleavage/methylation domain-containing protein [Paraburkholderia madseniana]MCX4171893.1 prepilin-type N-terminal cleavage/methylation domain-containing protein [Paraburkholderia madseniana]MDN7153605.1 prepilin-type N-terminal cleavage/methylation domain-containing protein [Paraburkholderia sp. WS6]MDQ6412487.1 prepilin-type N-terminal cleavage/methyl